MRSGAAVANRVDRLRELVLEAGLSDRVRVGVPTPPGGSPPIPRTHSTSQERQTPGAEEAFSPDVLLRPTGRADPRLGFETEGRLIELCGGVSSGKTALAYRMAAGATLRAKLVGWIDLPNALDPRFLLRAGVRLEDVLWVRPPDLQAALRSAELLAKTGFGLLVLDLEGAPQRELLRLGPSVWTRLQRVLRESRATALLLGTLRAAGSFATLGLAASRRRALFDAGLFEGLESRLEILRNRAAPADGELDFRVAHRP